MVVRLPGTFASLIRFGARLRGIADLDNHVAIMHHRTAGGQWRCIQAQPGGVAWADAQPYLDNPYTVTNFRQPKDDSQRFVVTSVVEAMLGTSYDWPAIAEDALEDLHIPDLWKENWHGRTPDHVVCSSLASWAYFKAGLANPSTDKLSPAADMSLVQPGDWEQWITARHFN